MKKGFSGLLIILIISSAILIVGGGTYYFKKNPKDQVIEITPDQKIKKVVSEQISNQSIVENFKLTNISNSHARGEIIIDGILQNFYFILIGKDWKIVETNSNSIFCEKAEKMGFPTNMVSDCLYQAPNSETPSSLKNKTFNDFESDKTIQVIGDFNIGSDPFSGSFQVADNNGDIVDINFGGISSDIVENINNNDFVIVEVSISENENGDIEFNLENIEEIETDVNETQTFPNNNNNSQNSRDGQGLEDTDLSEEIYYNITDLPPGAVLDLESYYQSLIDRDFSDKEIELISDF